jgi:hypothetical protein
MTTVGTESPGLPNCAEVVPEFDQTVSAVPLLHSAVLTSQVPEPATGEEYELPLESHVKLPPEAMAAGSPRAAPTADGRTIRRIDDKRPEKRLAR